MRAKAAVVILFNSLSCLPCPVTGVAGFSFWTSDFFKLVSAYALQQKAASLGSRPSCASLSPADARRNHDSARSAPCATGLQSA